ncbi:MAG TPA: PQQ-binding-like beta-propeller repeat protein [Gemmataceae bacterium]|jgi:outer membrane protein assembly factor BamB
MRRGNRTAALIVGIGLLVATPAHALITRPMPLRLLLEDSTFIVAATVESVDADKPAMVVVVEENLKGKSPLRKLPVLFKGDAEAKKNKHVPLILKRVAPKLPLVLFILQRDKKYTAFAYTNGTWFQIVGVESDGVVRWSFTHGEPYLRKTYKGGTADLKRIIVDGLAGKKEPPKSDSKEKPGFGPEVEAEKKSGSRAPLTGGPIFAVIPSVLVGGPLAILAMLFPAVFGGLMLVLRRWMAALSVLSLNSTLYCLYLWCGRWLAGSWWGTPLALWLTMTVLNLLGILWAWRRHVAFLAAEPQPPSFAPEKEQRRAESGERKAGSGRGELIALGVLSVLCLAIVIFMLPHSLARLDLGGKMLWMFSAGLWMATLHALYRRWTAAQGRAVKPGLPGEGVLLWMMLLAGAGFSATLRNESAGAGLTENANDSAGTAWRYRVAWRFRPSVERCWMASSPAVDGDRVYIGVVLPSAFNNSGAVYCIDRKTGKEIWMFNAGGDMKDVFSSPCVADGRLYIGEGFHQHSDCKLYCLDAATGKKLWDFATASHTESTPCVSGGKVYFGAGDDGLYCLDVATGQEKWHLKGLHVDANPLVIDNRLYGGSGIGDAYKETVLFCANADTGELHWRMPVDLPVWGMPAVQGEYVYAGIGNGNFLDSADEPAGAVLCLERATGKRVWRYDVRDGVHVRVCVDAKNVWFASRDQHCYCLDRLKGTLCWKTDLGSPILASPFLVAGDGGAGLYVASSDGLVSRLDPATGKLDWTFDVPKDTDQNATVFSSPLVQARAGGKGESRLIWFGSGLNEYRRGILYCLEERSAEKAD